MEIRTIGPFLHYFGNVRERTMRVARFIPPDKIDWTYAPAKFTLGDLLRHVAVAERYMWAENVQGRTGSLHDARKRAGGRLRQRDGVCRTLARGIDGHFRTTHR